MPGPDDQRERGSDVPPVAWRPVLALAAVAGGVLLVCGPREFLRRPAALAAEVTHLS
jgi:hypothetical protein